MKKVKTMKKGGNKMNLTTENTEKIDTSQQGEA
jgi:hypothetical protein